MSYINRLRFDSKSINQIQRNNYDFELLYRQQREIQKLAKQEDISLIQMKNSHNLKPYANVSLLFLTATNPFRQVFIRIFVCPWFDRAILSIIVINSILMALNESTQVEEIRCKIDFAFVIIYSIESIIKIIAKGFILSKNTYLRDYWNIFDFFIVSVGWIGIIIQKHNFLIIRTVRLLRPLRMINSLPEFKVIVASIMNSIPLLIDVLGLFLLSIFLFGIITTRIYSGLYDQMCFWPNGTSTQNPCYLDENCNESEVDCGNSGCDSGQYCWHSHENLNNGVTSFDNLLVSSLTVANVIFIEGWSLIMFTGRAVLGNIQFNDFLFIFIIIFGAFFLANLIITVLYIKLHEAFIEQNIRKKGKQIIIEVIERIDCSPKMPSNFTSWKHCWYLTRKKMHSIVKSNFYNSIADSIIIANTAIMASEYYGMSSAHELFIEITNTAFAIFFAIEMCIKFIGLGFNGYVSDNFNIFDGILVFIGFAEIVLLANDDLVGRNYLLIFRSLRIFRVFKLARRWASLRFLIEKMAGSSKSVIYLGLLCFIVIFVYALVGRQYFGGKLKDENGNSERTNYDTLFWSLITVFQLLTEENWNNVWYSTVKSVGWISTLYYFTFLIIGSHILLNLFLAILLEQFGENHSESSQKQQCKSKDLKKSSLINKEIEKKRKEKLNKKVKEIAERKYNPLPIYGKSLNLFSTESRVRLFFRSILLHPYFNLFIYSIVILSSAFSILDSPSADLYTIRVLVVARKFAYAAFIFDCITKTVALGFINEKNAYLKDGWNAVDFFILTIGTVNLISVNYKEDLPPAYFQALLFVVSIRPFRIASRNVLMNKIVTSLLNAFPVLINVMVLSLLNYLMFGVMGVILFKGSFYYCNDLSIKIHSECIGQYFDGETLTDRIWKNSFYSFDDIFQAMNTLFQISSLENWPSYLYTLVDAVGPKRSLQRDYNQYAALYYVVFICITTFFIINLFIGAVIKKFSEFQEELDGSYLLTAKQMKWVKTQKLLLKCSPRIRYIRPKGRLRGLLFDFVQNYKFDYLVMGVLGINLVFVSFHSSSMSKELTDFLWLTSFGFILLYTIEFILKIVALGPKYYFAIKWNTFDFLVIFVSYLSFGEYFSLFSTKFSKIIRVVRILRILKFLRRFKSIFDTLLLSAPSLINVMLLILLLLWTYANSGVALWGKMHHNVYINENSNFETFYNALITLLAASTGENWTGIYLECYGVSECNGSSVNCGSPAFAVIYWLTFQTLASFIFLNIFIAVLIENFERLESNDTEIAGLNSKDLKCFEKAWSIYAPYGERFVKTKYLPSLLNNLEAPLGFKGQNLSKAQMISIIHALKIKEHNGRVQFEEIIWVLTSSVCGEDMSVRDIYNSSKPFDKNSLYKLPSYHSNFHSSIDCTPAAKSLAALVLLRTWRRFKAKKTQNA